MATSSSMSAANKSVRFSDFDEISTIDPLPPRHHHLEFWQPTHCNEICTIDNFCHSQAHFVPAFYWLRKYEWKLNFLSDLIAGLYIATYHIPQGLAYSTLCNLPGVIGIYMGTFPALIYFFFGTSQHLSVGAFSSVTFMTRDIIVGHKTDPQSNSSQPVTNNSFDSIEVKIATSVTLWVGLYQLVMYVLQLGFFATTLSKTFVSALTSGVAIQIIALVLPEVLGITIIESRGFFRIFYLSMSLVNNIHATNFSSVILSVVTCSILIFDSLAIKPTLRRKCRVSLPMELIIIIICTQVSVTYRLSDLYSTPVVGKMPPGIPEPTIPDHKLLGQLWQESIYIAIIASACSSSVALNIAHEGMYKVDINQEFLAYGLTNVFACFLSCMPVSGSLSRSWIQYRCKACSQIASIISVIILLSPAVWYCNYFEPLPRSVLASIVVMTLVEEAFLAQHFIQIWNVSRKDGTLWLSTFLTTIILDIKYGLIFGVFATLLLIYYQSTMPNVCILGRITVVSPTEDKQTSSMFVDLRHLQASEIPGIKIIQFTSSLHFGNKAFMKVKIERLSGVSPKIVVNKRRAMIRKSASPEEIQEEIKTMITVEYRLHHLETTSNQSGRSVFITKQELEFIIIDLNLVHFIDQSAIASLQALLKLYRQIDINTYVVSRNQELMVKLNSVPNVRAALKEISRYEHIGLDI